MGEANLTRQRRECQSTASGAGPAQLDRDLSALRYRRAGGARLVRWGLAGALALAACASRSTALAPSAEPARLDAGASAAVPVKLRLHQSCGHWLTEAKPEGGNPCEPGLVCCAAPSGVYRPPASCEVPCGPGQSFCFNGCYSPPVP